MPHEFEAIPPFLRIRRPTSCGTHMIVVVVVVVVAGPASLPLPPAPPKGWCSLPASPFTGWCNPLFSGAACVTPLEGTPAGASVEYAGMSPFVAPWLPPVVIAVAMEGSIFWSTGVCSGAAALASPFMFAAGVRWRGWSISVGRTLGKQHAGSGDGWLVWRLCEKQ